jgi:hypothetical protein
VGEGVLAGFRLLAAPAAQHVSGHGPGRAGETNEGAVGLKFGADAGKGLADIGQVGGGAFYGVLHRLNGGQFAQSRAFAGLEPDLLAQSLRDQQDVGEDDGPVHGEPAHGLQGDFGRHLRVEAQVHEAAGLGAQLTILRQDAARLAHEPHRRAGHGLPLEGPDETGFGHAGLKARPAVSLKPGRPPASSSPYSLMKG